MMRQIKNNIMCHPPSAPTPRTATARRRDLGFGPILAVLAGLAMAAGLAGPAAAQAGGEGAGRPKPVTEYRVKAAFLYNFVRFTEWPEGSFEDATTPIRLCILGQDPFGKALDSIRQKKIKHRDIRVVRLLWADEAKQCHVLFIAASARDRLAQIFDFLDGSPVLTVGDMPEAAQVGGIIGLQIVDRKIRFKINVDAARQSGLKLSSRLLNLAVIERNGTGPKAGLKKTAAAQIR